MEQRRLDLVGFQEQDHQLLSERILLWITRDGGPQDVLRERPCFGGSRGGEGAVGEDASELEIAFLVGGPECQVFAERVDRLAEVPGRDALIDGGQKCSRIPPHLKLVEDPDPAPRGHEEQHDENRQTGVEAASVHVGFHETGERHTGGIRVAAVGKRQAGNRPPDRGSGARQRRVDRRTGRGHRRS